VLDSLAFDLGLYNARTCRQILAARLRYVESFLIVVFSRLNVALGVFDGIIGVMLIIWVFALFVSRLALYI
jgi:hypothetical protein